MDNVADLNDMRRVRNMEKAVKIYEKQLADLKKSTAILDPHREFLFFSITVHSMREEQKKIAAELLRLRLRLDKAKNPNKYEFTGETNE
jgi:hypothetical protein